MLQADALGQVVLVRGQVGFGRCLCYLSLTIAAPPRTPPPLTEAESVSMLNALDLEQHDP